MLRGPGADMEGATGVGTLGDATQHALSSSGQLEPQASRRSGTLTARLVCQETPSQCQVLALQEMAW